jgi:hypothetical protein
MPCTTELKSSVGFLSDILLDGMGDLQDRFVDGLLSPKPPWEPWCVSVQAERCRGTELAVTLQLWNRMGH